MFGINFGELVLELQVANVFTEGYRIGFGKADRARDAR